MSDTAKMNPLVSIAAVAVTAASVVGIGAMTGFIPGASKTDKPSTMPITGNERATLSPPLSTPSTPSTLAALDPPPFKAPMESTQPQPPKKLALAEPAPRAAPRPSVAQYPPTGAGASVPRPAVVAQAAPAVCKTCGRVVAVNVQQVKGDGTGLGAVVGGVAGGLLGNQVGRGNGRTVATVAGVAGGAVAGHQVERYAKSSQQYNVVVRMDDGTSRVFPYQSAPGFRAGERVRVAQGGLQRQ
jgi:outer membrane lipoprotein SlyB